MIRGSRWGGVCGVVGQPVKMMERGPRGVLGVYVPEASRDIGVFGREFVFFGGFWVANVSGSAYECIIFHVGGLPGVLAGSVGVGSRAVGHLMGDLGGSSGVVGPAEERC